MRLSIILLIALLSQAAVPSLVAEVSEVSSMHVTLPSYVDGWAISAPAKRIEPNAIFEYMDGAGELYLGYRFRSLEVYEYTKPGASDIQVELYWMESSDDAYGLLSVDWGGVQANLGLDSAEVTPSIPRALYGSGLLRIWSGGLYARVLVYQETEKSKQAVMNIGRSIVQGRPEPAVPGLVQSLPKDAGQQYTLRSDRTVFLRSHLVLNSVYFLGADNLLNLGQNCALTAAEYSPKTGEASSKSVRMLLVRYPDEFEARKALDHFQGVYFASKTIGDESRGVVHIEDGWAGFLLSGRDLGLIFEAPDEQTARLFLEVSKRAFANYEVFHERP
jgi:hypothetical protein